MFVNLCFFFSLMYVLIFYIIILMLCCVICFCRKPQVMGRKEKEVVHNQNLLRRSQKKNLKKNMSVNHINKLFMVVMHVCLNIYKVYSIKG